MKKEKKNLIPIILVSLSCILFIVAIILIMNINYFELNNTTKNKVYDIIKNNPEITKIPNVVARRTPIAHKKFISFGIQYSVIIILLNALHHGKTMHKNIPCWK